MDICTIVAKNYVAHARVLATSFREAHPEGRCAVLVIDDPSSYIDGAKEPFELLTLDAIGLPDPERMAAIYDVMELSTAVKPWLLRTLLDRPDVEAVTYLDPDIRVFAPLDEISRRVAAHDVVLTPHFNKPLFRDGRKPSEEDILIAGSYNLGFISLRDGDTARALLDWWSERLEGECLNEPERGRFVDQRWIDLAPGLWPGIDVLRDPEYNIAYWNLATRELEQDGDGYRVDGRPLRFFHFSGFDPRRPDELSKHQNRITVADHPALSRICREYAEALLENGFEDAVDWPYSWGEMPNGVPLDRAARRVFRDALEAGQVKESIFTAAGAEWFTGYLKEDPVSRPAGHLNRYAQALWDTRPDFRESFPDIGRSGAPAYAAWLHAVSGPAGLAENLLPLATSDPAATATRKPPTTRPGVNLVGYLSSKRGVGEAARKMRAALEGAGIAEATIDTPTDPDEIHAALKDLPDARHPYDFNLICVNADMLPHVAAALGPRFFEARHSIGFWFWEVSHFPKTLHGAFDHVDEVWVASEHVAGALRPVSPKPVETMRMPVVPGPPDKLTREEMGLPEGFCFLFAFDYRSVFRRKNPLGLVEAFRRAFEPGEGPSLVLKSIGGDGFPAEREALADAISDRLDIHVIDDKVPLGVKNAMIASCDCYVSLHRSEGFGLTMAEAMYFGRPVIATAYSGNLDFMTEDNSFLVPHRMVEIGPDADPYPADEEWAEPDLDQAAELMRNVYENPEDAARRGRRAAEDIRRTHSPEAAGRLLKERLEGIRRSRLITRLEHPSTAHAAAGAPGGRGHLEHLLHFSEPPPPPDASRFKVRAKRLYMRLLRPYAAHQQRINTAVAESLDEVREVLRETLRVDVEKDEQIRALMAQVDELSGAAGAEPYMADDRLRDQSHPLLGRTLGFRPEQSLDGNGGYRAFEDLFRGSEQMIRERQEVYLDLVTGNEPVLDAGCGRGEFLDLLASRGIAARGVDLDTTMVERCRQKGHANVERGDLVEYLEGLPADSLGAIFSAQVIEHLPFAHLKRFLELSLSRLRPGGLLIAETVNPHSPAALKAFWVDPTHQHPLFPETLLSLCAIAGFAGGDIFAPLGAGDWAQDRMRVGEYAVVTTAPGTAAAEHSG